MLAMKLFRGPPFAKSAQRIFTKPLCFRSPGASFSASITAQPFHHASQACHRLNRPNLRSQQFSIKPSNHIPKRPFSRAPPRRDQYGHHRRRPLPYQLIASLSRGQYTVVAVVATGAATIFYVSNLETVPVSGRRRFNCFSESSAEEQGQVAYQQIMAQERSQGKILGDWDSRVNMVKRVLNRLVEGGNLGNVKWEVHVIDDPGTINAFVLPGGKVFVYTGILPITRNDEGLAAVLGHEIAHNVAQHAAERMSSAIMVQPLIWAAIALEASYGGTGQLSHWLANLLLDLGIMRPASRQQESEADYIGLILMAQSCYDPEAAVGLWKRMEAAQKGAPPEWLSTHPSNEHRVERITHWLPKAQQKRLESGCSSTIRQAGDFRETIKAMQDGFWF